MEVGNLLDVLREDSDLFGPATGFRVADRFLCSEVAGLDLKHADLGDGERTSEIRPASKEERDVEHLARHDRVVMRDFHRGIPETIEIGKTAEEFVAIRSPLTSVHLGSFFGCLWFGS